MKEDDRFNRGIAHFNARQYFEAHEVWEELWLATANPEKTFLQGMIQVAAAFHHRSRGNARGTVSLLAAGIAKLKGYPESHRGIALGDLRREAEQWMETTIANGEDKSLRLPIIRLSVSPPAKEKSADT
jgi:uncharacterized protein